MVLGGGCFLMSEIPLYCSNCPSCKEATPNGTGVPRLRKRTALGPISRTMPRVLGGSEGGGVFLWARYSCSQAMGARKAFQ